MDLLVPELSELHHPKSGKVSHLVVETTIHNPCELIQVREKQWKAKVFGIRDGKRTKNKKSCSFVNEYSIKEWGERSLKQGTTSHTEMAWFVLFTVI